MNTDLIVKYTGHELDPGALPASAGQLAELIADTTRALEGTEAQLRQAADHLRKVAAKVDANLDAGPNDRVHQLDPGGELHGHGIRLDALVAVRDQQIQLLRTLVHIAAHT